MKQPFWETTYSDINARSFGSRASEEILDLMNLLPEGSKVLDLGCGDGRNAIPLAEAGFHVTAVDISKAGIGKLQTLAEDRGLFIQTVVADIGIYRIQSEYDLIAAHGCLHLLERTQWKKLIREMQAHTSPVGYNAVTVFTDSVPASPDMEDFFVGMFREGELFSIYSHWNILLRKSYTFRDEHPGGIHHLHAANKLVAGKPAEEKA
ncbi:MAG: methyltransferase domain-containing protein [Candidatus Sabulitectum sp.]|nr:methyltransferase domain-containing protein [Candidatus Sabulitectum sp.]